jgi:hypothetical protein
MNELDEAFHPEQWGTQDPPPTGLEILHHHAAAIDWLCEQLEARLGTDNQQWRRAALSHALDRWYCQTPDEMQACLERNIAALQEVINDNL